MRKIIILILSILFLTSFAFAAESTGGVSGSSDSATINLLGSVQRSAGVVVPTNAKLVGNLAIAYDYNNRGTFSYISSDIVRVVDLGIVGGVIRFRADYYGNEPEEYGCNVTFSSEGWNLISDTSKYNLPINFSIPEVNSDIKKIGVNVDPIEEGAFRLTVPVNSPINGDHVVFVDASWKADPMLPSGDYTADIVIEVQSIK